MIHHRPVLPPIGGASRLIMDTWEALAKKGHNVLIVSIRRKPVTAALLSKNLAYIELRESIAASLALTPTRLASYVTREKLLFVHTIVLSKAYERTTKAIITAARSAGLEPQVVVSEQPYTCLLAHSISRSLDAPLILREHNVEAEYLAKTAPPRIAKHAAYAFLKIIEQQSLLRSNRVLAVSRRDALLLQSLLPRSEASKVVFLEPLIIKRGRNLGEKLIRKLGLEPYNYVLFAASSHTFNLQSLKALIKASRSIKSTVFTIIGTICKYLKHLKPLPPNIKALGVVDDDTLHTLYTYALAAYAPFPHGTGIPIKLVEALTYGLPVITTPNALPTLKELKHEENVYAAPLNVMHRALTKALDPSILEKLRKGAVKLATKLSEDVLAGKYEAILLEACKH